MFDVAMLTASPRTSIENDLAHCCGEADQLLTRDLRRKRQGIGVGDDLYQCWAIEVEGLLKALRKSRGSSTRSAWKPIDCATPA